VEFNVEEKTVFLVPQESIKGFVHRLIALKGDKKQRSLKE